MATVGGRTFTDEQLRRYKRVFDLFDVNKNGKIDSREMAAMAKVLGYHMQSPQIKEMMAKFDFDRNAVLTFDEFLQAMPGNTKNISEEEHKRAEYRRKFMEFDRDGNGYITPDEACGVLSRELGFSPDKTRSLVSQFDTNRDGQLSYDEFIGFYMKVKEKKTAIDIAFRQFDRDRKGYVTVDDARRILINFGFSSDEIVALVRTHDTNRDGKLQYDEFVNFWAV